MLNVLGELEYVTKETLFGDDETRERLIEIKKDIIKDFIETIKNNKPDIEDLGERLENYLINDGSIEDVFQDIFRGYQLSLDIPEYMDVIEKHKLKEKISSMQNIPTSEELSTLKSEIISIGSEIQANPTDDTQGSRQQTEQNQTTPTSTAIASVGTATGAGIEASLGIEENKFVELVYNRASQQIGKPYLRGGTSPDKGFDCSGLRYRAFREEGIRFSERFTAHKFSDADVDIRKDQVKPGDFIFWDQKPGKKKHNPIYHIEMAISKPYTKNGKTYIRTLGSSTDAKDDCGNYVGKGVQIREREMKDYRHYGRPRYYYQLAQHERTGSNDVLKA